MTDPEILRAKSAIEARLRAVLAEVSAIEVLCDEVVGAKERSMSSAAADRSRDRRAPPPWVVVEGYAEAAGEARMALEQVCRGPG